MKSKDWFEKHGPLFVERGLVRDTLRLGLAPGHGWRRVLATLGVAVGHLTLVTINRMGRTWDNWRHPGYRDVALRAPVFIIAPPRSGTTMFHRLLCEDPRFAHINLAHTLFPSVVLARLLGWLERSEMWLPRLFRRVLTSVEDSMLSGWDDIHFTRFFEAEEDEGLYFLTMISPGLYLFVPEVDTISRVDTLDDWDQHTRRRVMSFYTSSLKRLMFVLGSNRVFLGKSVFLPGRIESLMERFPDARFVHLVRSPYETIPSFISMFIRPWRWHSPKIAENDARSRALMNVVIEQYRRMVAAREALGEERLITLRYEDVVRDPRAAVTSVYDWLGWLPDSGMDARLRRHENKGYRSRHRYTLEQFGLSEREVRDAMGDVFDAYDFAA